MAARKSRARRRPKDGHSLLSESAQLSWIGETSPLRSASSLSVGPPGKGVTMGQMALCRG